MKSRPTKTKAVTGEELLQSLFPDMDTTPAKPAPPSPIEALRHWRRSPDAKYVGLREQLIPTKSSQPADLIALATGSGFEEISGPVAEVLRRLSRSSRIRRSPRATNIPVDRVLSYIWHHARIARTFAMSAKGTKPPPISAYEVRFAKESFFLVYDGHHRTEACKMRGDAHVAAVVKQVFVFEPNRWSPIRRGVRSADGDIVLLPEDERAAARWLGIRRR